MKATIDQPVKERRLEEDIHITNTTSVSIPNVPVEKSISQITTDTTGPPCASSQRFQILWCWNSKTLLLGLTFDDLQHSLVNCAASGNSQWRCGEGYNKQEIDSRKKLSFQSDLIGGSSIWLWLVELMSLNPPFYSPWQPGTGFCWFWTSRGNSAPNRGLVVGLRKLEYSLCFAKIASSLRNGRLPHFASFLWSVLALMAWLVWGQAPVQKHFHLRLLQLHLQGNCGSLDIARVILALNWSSWLS